MSMGNMKEVRSICDEHGVLLVIDGCRIAENSYFIKHREKGYEDKTYKEIAQELLRLGDAFMMSAKKDALVNMGGILAVKNEDLAIQCTNLLIISEGFATYGGLTGRDMEAIAIGLQEVFDADYLHYRIVLPLTWESTCATKAFPAVWPIGGHAVYIDSKKLYPHIQVEQYPGKCWCAIYTKGRYSLRGGGLGDVWKIR